jgi:hypothetical protein
MHPPRISSRRFLFNVTSLQHCPPGDAINRTNKVLFQKIRFDGSILRLHQAIHMFLPEDLRQSPNPLGSGRVTDIWIRVIHRARFLGISPALSCPAITRARSGVHHGLRRRLPTTGAADLLAGLFHCVHRTDRHQFSHQVMSIFLHYLSFLFFLLLLLFPL